MRRVVTLCLIAAGALTALALPAAAGDFKLEKYFAGRTVAKGEFSAINFTRRRFDVVLTGRWNGKRLKLIEDFAYADGERDRKTWYFVKTGENTYLGTREDVLGQAKVTITGNTARFAYDVYLDGATRKNLVRFHDKMVLRNDDTVLNTAYVTKYGLPVATTRVSFSR